jgi:hypothetical protein
MDSTVWPLFSMLCKEDATAVTIEEKASSVERKSRITPLAAKFGLL